MINTLIGMLIYKKAYLTNLFTRVVPGTTHDYDLNHLAFLKCLLPTLVLLSDAFDLYFQKLSMILIRVLQIKFIRIPFQDSQII